MQSSDKLFPFMLVGLAQSIEIEKERIVKAHNKIKWLQSQLDEFRPVRRKSNLTPAGRKKLSDSMKKRHKMMLAAKKKKGRARATA